LSFIRINFLCRWSIIEQTISNSTFWFTLWFFLIVSSHSVNNHYHKSYKSKQSKTTSEVFIQSSQLINWIQLWHSLIVMTLVHWYVGSYIMALYRCSSNRSLCVLILFRFFSILILSFIFWDYFFKQLVNLTNNISILSCICYYFFKIMNCYHVRFLFGCFILIIYFC
jgi:hypothetical protein